MQLDFLYQLIQLENIFEFQLLLPLASNSLAKGAFIITKLCNCPNKSTFERIACLKSWGVFKDKLKEAKKEEKKSKNQELIASKEDNQFFIIKKEV